MAWACNRAKGAPGLMGGMDGQKALGIELLSIQSMDAGAGRRSTEALQKRRQGTSTAAIGCERSYSLLGGTGG